MQMQMPFLNGPIPDLQPHRDQPTKMINKLQIIHYTNEQEM